MSKKAITRVASVASAFVLMLSFMAAGTAPVSAQNTGIEVSLPSYVWPNDSFLTDMIDEETTPTPPSVVILNKSGDVSDLDENSDALRARTTAYDENVKTIGYVNTRVWVSGVGMSLRPLQDIKDEVDA